MFKLVCGHQNYDWGRVGLESLVFKLRSLQNPDLPSNQPFAELWMGTHPNMPSFVIDSLGEKVKLSEYLNKEPEKYLGKTVEKFKTKNDLPFLFKILSVAKPLSIQAHPDKKLAEILHKTMPNEYKDDNHKPEMAIALTEFKAFCNFAKASKILSNIEECEELKTLFSASLFKGFKEDSSKENLKALIEDLFSKTDEEIKKTIECILTRLGKQASLSQREQLTIHLHKEFPFDIGVLFTYFMNFVNLQPGEALLMEAGEPHCYIFGDCIESMACSDNVVRAGLTPKFKDKKTLCEMLTYKMSDGKLIKPNVMSKGENKEVLVYESYFDEFVTQYLHLGPLDKGQVLEEAIVFEYPAIGIVVEGKGKAIQEKEKLEVNISAGDVLFFSPHERFLIGSSDSIKIYLCTSK